MDNDFYNQLRNMDAIYVLVVFKQN